MLTTTNPANLTTPDRSYALPPLGDNPSTDREGTTPGSFALRGRVGTPWTFSSPDTLGMPQPSDRTAWDFLPPGWSTDPIANRKSQIANAITQLESARLGIVT